MATFSSQTCAKTEPPLRKSHGFLISLIVTSLVLPQQVIAESVGETETGCQYNTAGHAVDAVSLCEVIANTPLCKTYEAHHPGSGLRCGTPGTPPFGFMDYVQACGDAVMGQFQKAWKLIMDLVETALHPIAKLNQATQEKLAFHRAASGYLASEYQRVYDESSAPGRTLKAAGAVSAKLMGAAFEVMGDILQDQLGEFVCMNSKARMAEVCKQIPLLLATGGGVAVIKGLTKYFEKYGRIIPPSAKKFFSDNKVPQKESLDAARPIRNLDDMSDRRTPPQMEELLYAHSRTSDVERTARTQSDELYRRYKSDPDFAAWADQHLKDNPEMSPGEMVNSLVKGYPGPQGLNHQNAVLNLNDPDLQKETHFSGSNEFGANPNTTTQYQIQMTKLRSGDVIQGESAHLGNQQFKLGKFAGSGNQTHVFELENDPQHVLRLEFNASGKGDNKDPYHGNRVYSETREKFTDIPDLHVIEISDRGKNFEYLKVEKIPPSKNGAELMDRFNHLIEKESSGRKLSMEEQAEVNRFYNLADRIEPVLKKIAERSGDPERIANLNSEENFFRAARAELRQIQITPSGDFYLVDWEVYGGK